ncbi:MAG: ROK family protein [Acidimicrobiales bacterium]
MEAAAEPGCVLALDVGGTKLAAGVVDHRGALLDRAQTPTPRWAGAEGEPAGAEALFAEVLGLLAALPPSSPAALGVGCGGPMSGLTSEAGAEVSPLNIPAWRAFPLAARLAEATGLAVFVDNDAKALARGEGWVGAAAGRASFMSMVVSTGVGGGIVLDGRLLEGAAGNAGHVGHVIVAPEGRWCACGARGCLEAEASGPSIEAATGRPAAHAGPEVRARTGRLVGRAAASVCNLLDLQLVTVAGSVALGFGAAFFDAAQEELDRSCRLLHSRGARITPAGLGADGPLVGAGAVAWAGLRGR